MMLTLYQSEWCPYCHRVRQVLSELELTYLAVNVPAGPENRSEVMVVSSQDGIPMLTDGDRVFVGSDDIIQYLRAAYRAPRDIEETAALGAWRAARSFSLAPRAALAHLHEVLAEKGFTIVSQIRGPKLNERLPKEYVLLHVAIPVAAAKTVEFDPLAPNAVVLPIAVVPTEGGNSVIAAADPLGQVWLYGEPGLIEVEEVVRQRLAEVLDAL